MADQKLSALTELAVEPADTDEVYINDGGVSKRITYGTLKAALLARANHTGTQTASTISDFDTEVSNNSDVAANTAKVTNATHTGDATGSGALTLQPAAITGKGAVTVAGSDLLLVADVSVSPQALGQVTAQSVANLFDASGYLPLSGGQLTGDITFSAASPEHTIDGRNVSADGAKLDGIEAGADVTDTANVTAAGALMDSEVTNLAAVKAFDPTDYATAAQGSTADSALQNVVEDATPQLGGELDAQGNDIANLGDVTFQTGATGGTMRTGTSAADKFVLQGYDNNDTTYRTVMEVDAGNAVQLQVIADYLYIEDGTDLTKKIQFNASGITTSTTRTITMPDADVNLGDIATNSAKVTNATHTGDATGATALTLQATAISGKTDTTATASDEILLLDVSASPNTLGRETVGDLLKLRGFEFSADVPTVADQDYELWWDAPFAGTVTTVRTKTQSGTCTVTGYVWSASTSPNLTALGGTANSASTTAQEQSHSSSNTFAKGDRLLFTVTSNSAATDLSVIFYGTRT